MNDDAAPLPRPVSLAAVAVIFLLLSLFWVVAVAVYVPRRPPAPQNEAPENLPKELAWRATPESRRAHLADLREKEWKEAGTYGWVDRNAGLVRLPIERAMELVAKENGGSQ